MKKILITGGAGYKGTLLARAVLARGHAVTVLDNFMYGFDPVLGFASDPNCSIVKKDIRNIEASDVEGYDVIYHLAAISGYPACEANPHSAQTINVDSTQMLIDLMDDDQLLIYASTTSMYGKRPERQDETTPPAPGSLYGMTKYAGEKIAMTRENSIAFRFATLFGASLKMRPDLMLNDFVHKAVTERSLVLFDEHSVRTFLHVNDSIRTYLMALDDARPFIGNVFNVGSEKMNFSKLDIAQRIKKYVEMEIVHSSLADLDKRDFIIDFSRIAELGFELSVDLDTGIQELIRLYNWYRPYVPYQTI